MRHAAGGALDRGGKDRFAMRGKAETLDILNIFSYLPCKQLTTAPFPSSRSTPAQLRASQYVTRRIPSHIKDIRTF